jgi:hypothetical protein
LPANFLTPALLPEKQPERKNAGQQQEILNPAGKIEAVPVK